MCTCVDVILVTVGAQAEGVAGEHIIMEVTSLV